MTGFLFCCKALRNVARNTEYANKKIENLCVLQQELV